MTDAALQALIDAARTGPSDLVTWNELKAILEGLKSQTSLTDLTPSSGDVPQWNGTSWVTAAAGGGVTAGSGNGTTVSSGVVNLGEETFDTNAIFTHTSQNGRFTHRIPTSVSLSADTYIIGRELRNSEFGTNASVGGWYETVQELQTNQEGNPTARKNVVWSWGYNYTTGEAIAGEGYMRIGMESNYRPGGGEEWFEFHFPEVKYRTGQTSRWYSVIADKDDPTDARHLLDASQWQLRYVNDTSKVFAKFGFDSQIAGGNIDLYATAVGAWPSNWSVRFSIANDDALFLIAPRNGGRARMTAETGDLWIAAAETGKYVDFYNARVKFTGIVNAANDGAAATAGVQVGAIYRNGSVLQIRVA